MGRIPQVEVSVDDGKVRHFYPLLDRPCAIRFPGLSGATFPEPGFRGLATDRALVRPEVPVRRPAIHARRSPGGAGRPVRLPACPPRTRQPPCLTSTTAAAPAQTAA